LLNLLVHTQKNPYGGNRQEIADRIASKLGSFGRPALDASAALDNYVDGKRAPEPFYAWSLGEALRNGSEGVPWMNGYCMLWQAGAYEAALATTFEYVVQNGNVLRTHQIDAIWTGATAGMQIGRFRSQLDYEPGLLQHVLTDTGPTLEVDSILKALVAAPSPTALPLDSSDYAYERSREADVVAMRDIAMTHWHDVTQYIESLERAFVTACIETKGTYQPRHRSVPDDIWAQGSAADTLAAVALDVARSSAMPVSSVETGLLILLGQYLNMLDTELNNGGRRMTPLPRWPWI